MPIPTRSEGSWRFDRGGAILSSGQSASGQFRGLLALADCTLGSGTAATDLTGTLDGLAVPKGATISARFTTVELTTGSAVLYR